MDGFFELLGVLLIFAFVLVITYLCSKWMAGFQKVHMKSRNLQFIETIPAGAGKTIGLMKAGEVYLVVAVGKDSITNLATLSEEQLTDLSFKEENAENNASFQEIFGQFKEKLSKK